MPTLLKATLRPRQAVLLTRPSHHPSVLQKRNRLGKAASWTLENANLLQRLLEGGPGWTHPRAE